MHIYAYYNAHYYEEKLTSSRSSPWPPPPPPPPPPSSSSVSSSSFHLLKSTLSQWYFFLSFINWGQNPSSFFLRIISIFRSLTNFMHFWNQTNVLELSYRPNFTNYRLNVCPVPKCLQWQTKYDRATYSIAYSAFAHCTH